MTKKQEYTESYKIALLTGSQYDLSKINFSCFGFKCSNINDTTFRDFFKGKFYEDDTKSDYESFMEQLDKIYNKQYGTEEYYALYSEEINIGLSFHEINLPYQALLTAYPSGLFFSHLFEFQERDGLLWGFSLIEYLPIDLELFHDHKLYTIDKQLKEINEYLVLFVDRYKSLNHLNHAIEFYVNSFQSNFIHQQFVSLITSLETIVEGKNQVSYRLRRNLAVLCGLASEGSKRIYKNVNKLYELRSRIVHGGTVDYRRINLWLPYLRSLASFNIVQYINMGLSLSELNIKLNELGFGQKDKINPENEEIIPNVMVYSDVSIINLTDLNG